MKSLQRSLTLKRWVLNTTYGWFIGILLVVGFAVIAETLFKMSDQSGGQAVVGIGMGAGVGLMQWLILRNYLASSKFFWYTLAGFSAAFIFRDITAIILKKLLPGSSITTEVTIPFAVILGAFISGWLQYKFVFKKITDNSISWIFYSVIGWLLATIITMSTSFLNMKFHEHFPKALIFIIALLFLTLGGPILGYVTGLFIIPKINEYKGKSSTDL